jgi:tight adherence protein B
MTSPTLMMIVTFFAALVFMGALLFAFAGTAGSGTRMVNRIERLKKRFRKVDDEERISVKRIAKEGWFKGFEVIARGVMPRPAEFRQRLAKTGRDIPVGNYMVVCMGVMLLSAVLAWFLFAFPPLLALGFGIICGFGLPHKAVSRMIDRRSMKFIANFPDAIDLMVRGLRSGLPITESMASVSQEIPDPVGKEFRRVVDGIRLGQTMEEALWETSARLGLPEFKFFVISLAIQRETGGNLAETLQNLTDVLRKRQQMKLKIKAMSSEARASAMIIGALPFVMFGILLFLNYGYTSLLFTDKRGLMMAGMGMISMGLGIGLINKMIKFEI